MPKLLQARPAVDAREARQVHQLATSTHAPADGIVHAKMILRSWEGARTTAIAAALRCHAQTVRERIQAFHERGLQGLGMRPGGGRKPRVTALERSTILALVKLPPQASRASRRTGGSGPGQEGPQRPREGPWI